MKFAGTAAVWTERYEALRRHAVNQGQYLTTEPLGFAVVCRYGIAGWMGTWQEAIATTPRLNALPPPAVISGGWKHELTVLLTEMTVQHLRPALS